MVQRDQPGASEFAQEQRATGDEWAAEARREESRAAYSQARPETGGRTRDTMRNAVSATEQFGSGVAGGVTNVAGGMIGAVRDTANTAIDGVGSVGQHAVHAVTGLLVELVGGVRQVAGAAVGGGKSASQEAMEAAYPQQGRPYAQETQRSQSVSREAESSVR